MEEMKARRVVDRLRQLGTDADLARVGVRQFGVTVKLPGKREAIWDADGTASLEANVMRDGMLVGYVPEIPGSADFSEDEIIEAIRGTDYDAPIATRAKAAPAPAPALPVKGGLYRRFFEGLRWK